uniref:UBC core domain-containing protein n=1 Tax=Meloidogyne javanica TaxID=6303 RepID=A0A915LQ42_MELJA
MGITVEPVNENMSEIIGRIRGPPVLLSVQNLLASPEPKDPQDAIVAKQYMANIELYNKTARYWTQHYANAPGEKDKEMVNLVNKLQEMGVAQVRDECIILNGEESCGALIEAHKKCLKEYGFEM